MPGIVAASSVIQRPYCAGNSASAATSATPSPCASVASASIRTRRSQYIVRLDALDLRLRQVVAKDGPDDAVRIILPAGGDAWPTAYSATSR
jgi:hypothetical protein